MDHEKSAYLCGTSYCPPICTHAHCVLANNNFGQLLSSVVYIGLMKSLLIYVGQVTLSL